jgi:hypothetical protein
MKTSKGARWFRLYAEFLDDPKVQMLSEIDQRRFLMLMCKRCSDGDVTSRDEEIAFHLRISDDEWRETKARLMQKNLINDEAKPIAWDKRQYASDSSAERTSAWRDRKKQHCDVTVTPPEKEKEKEKEKMKTIPANVARSRGSGDSSLGFDHFWDQWPKKVGKAEAEKAWKRLGPDEALQEQMLAAIDHQRDSDAWRKDGGAFIPNPATWLRGRRWEDDVGPVQVAYSAAEIEVMTAYNLALGDRGWPCAVATPFSSDRAASIREFSGFGTKDGWIEAYFGWLCDHLKAKEGFGFDWAIKRDTYLRAKEGNFTALQEAA